MKQQIPCQKCGSTEWTISMITDCDQCNPDLSIERLEKQQNCPHKNTEASNIIGFFKCLDCGFIG